MAEPFFVHDNATASGIALAHTIHGEPVTASLRPDSVIEGVAPVPFSEMRPYKKPARRSKDNGKELCATDGCKAYPMKDTGHCVGHSRSMGLIENWSPKHESD